MNTAAYLANQGWQGNGHALHHSGRGITKPLRVSQKLNTFGIGKKQHDAHADQWWARAFDDTLKGLNTATNAATGRTEGISLDKGAQALQIANKAGAKWVAQGGLYSNFVKGEGLSGTLSPEKKTASEDEGRREAQGDDEDEESVLRQPREKKKKKHKRKDRDHAVDTVEIPIVKLSNVKDIDDLSQGIHGETIKTETKAERRQRKKERRAKKALQRHNQEEVIS